MDAYDDIWKLDQELFTEAAQREDALSKHARFIDASLAFSIPNDFSGELCTLFFQDDDGGRFRHDVLGELWKVLSMMDEIRIGCASWNVPKADATEFPDQGTHLQRYSARFNCVEINSSFYRPHLPATYARWAESVPENFRFAVKMPRAITHDARLTDIAAALATFLFEVGMLGSKLGCLLIQLPPSLRFDCIIVECFLTMLRQRYTGSAVFEPRHPTWFDGNADKLLAAHGVGRVAADPALCKQAAIPGGDRRTVYFRLHGSPKIYYSTYAAPYLNTLAAKLSASVNSSAQTWCIFDNTALGAAVPNALQTMRLISQL